MELLSVRTEIKADFAHVCTGSDEHTRYEYDTSQDHLTREKLYSSIILFAEIEFDL